MLNNLTTRTKSFFLKCRRVWFSLRKPTMKEFQLVAKISALGVLILGAFGFFVSIAMNYFF